MGKKEVRHGMKTPPRSHVETPSQEKRDKLLSMTPVPGCIIVTRDDFLKMDQSGAEGSATTKRKRHTVTGGQLESAVKAFEDSSPKNYRKSEIIVSQHQMYFAVPDPDLPKIEAAGMANMKSISLELENEECKQPAPRLLS